MTTQQTSAYEGMLAESVALAGDKGDMLKAYLARPLGPGPYPGVVLIHEAFGMVEHTRELARKFADHGYIALAPNLYSREAPIDPNNMTNVMDIMRRISDAQVVTDLEGAAKYLNALPYCNGKLGCIGHCSGGRQTLLFASNTQSLSAAVDCYGGRVVTDERTPNAPVPVVEMVERLRCPLLGLFGESDQNPAPAHVARLEEELKKHRKTYEFKTYPADVGHGFFADYRPSYRHAAAVDGWQRIFDFFGRHLSG